MRNRYQTLRIILNSLGSLCLVLGGILMVPVIVVILNGELSRGYSTLFAFLIPSALAFCLGTVGRTLFRRGTVSVVHAMLICSLGWIAFSLLGALPFVIGIHASYLDGVFETMSGFTTTGITMFTGLDHMPRSVLFWRSFTQWVGGLGILTFFLAVTYRGGSAHMLFGAESHKIDVGRPVPGLAHTIKILWSVYAGYTLFIVLSLVVAGMPLFDSICHGFTTLSTGGFSPHDASIGYYRLGGYPHYIWIEYILIVGMLMGGTNFLIHYRILKGDGKALYDNAEMKYWWGLIGVFLAVILTERLLRVDVLAGASLSNGRFWREIEGNFRIVAFQVTSIITTTGFGTRDIGGSFFGHVAKQLFLVMMVIGGCVGSTGGGIKVLRVAILSRVFRREMYSVVRSRRAVSAVQIDGKRVEVAQIERVSGLFFAWIVLLVIGGIVTAFLSHFDGYRAFSGMFSALGNIGPCYIPVKAMGQLHACIKLVYIFGMLAGRLEILPVVLLFSSKAWQS